jgi:hypothetical protein
VLTDLENIKLTCSLLTFFIKNRLIRYMSLINLSVETLRKAADLKEKIAGLEKQLVQILGSSTKPATTKAPKKGGMSAAGKARIAKAQKARWAKIKAMKPAVQAKLIKTARKKMSAAAKAKLSKLAKARWAKVKATGKKKL